MNERVLVTGGNGFVASWCIFELLNRGYKVRTTVRSAQRGKELQQAIASVTSNSADLSVCIADLNQDAGWNDAAKDCQYVLHVASPLGGAKIKDDDLILPARDGTLRVLRSALANDVRRVVVTSSTAACTPTPFNPFVIGDETIWTDENAEGLTAYRKSKILAEKAVWEFATECSGKMSVVTILPGAILGPVLLKDKLGSAQIVKHLLEGQPPGVPHLGFCVVDVRDLADLHIRAMVAPEAHNQRFIATGDFMWMAEMAWHLRSALGDKAKKVPKIVLPDFAVKALSIFMPILHEVASMLSQKQLFTADKAKRILNFEPRPAKDAVIDCANSLLRT